MNSPFQETLQRRQDVLLYLPKIHSSLFNFHRKYNPLTFTHIHIYLDTCVNTYIYIFVEGNTHILYKRSDKRTPSVSADVLL